MMMTAAIQVPAALLLDAGLPVSARLLWMALRAGGLALARSELSRPTLKRGLIGLEAAGWYLPATGPQVPAGSSTTTVRVPLGLLCNRRVGAQGRVLYGILQVTPGFHRNTGSFTYAALSAMAGASRNTIKQAVRELVQSGWLQVRQANPFTPVFFALCDPEAAQGEIDLALVRRRLEEAPYFGEALMKEYLSLLVDSMEFEDNAAPGFLINPFTYERMELDRYYPPAVAFEFNGPHHYGPTASVTPDEVRKQQARDMLKRGICAERGISLITIHPDDLSLDAMRRKIGSLLPLRELAGREPVVRFLEGVSLRYRQSASRWTPQ